MFLFIPATVKPHVVGYAEEFVFILNKQKHR